MRIPDEFDDAARMERLVKANSELRDALNLKTKELEQVKAERDLAILSWSSQSAEIKRLRDALKAKIDSYEYDTSFYEIQEGLEALLKEQDNDQ